MRRDLCVLVILLISASPASAQLPNRRATLEAIRAEYPAQVTQQQAGEILARTVWDLRAEGFGLLKKTGGNRCPIPNSSTTVSCDWVIHRSSATGCDVLIDAPSATTTGRATPTWCAGEPVDVAKWVAPVNPGTPEPPPPDDALVARVDALERKVAALERTVAAQGLALASLAGRVTALEQAPAPPVPVIVCVETAINTSRDWGHGHSVKVPVCRVETKTP